MIEMIEKSLYAKLSLEEKRSYILDRAEMKDLWLIGRVRNPEEGNFFFIEELVNPYNGKDLNKELFGSHKRPLSIFCYRPKSGEGFENDVVVAARVQLGNDEQRILYKNEFFSAAYEDIVPIVEDRSLFDEVVEKLGLKIPDFRLLALAEPESYPQLKSRFADLAELARHHAEEVLNEQKNILRSIEESKEQLETKQKKLDATQLEIEACLHEIRVKREELTRIGIHLDSPFPHEEAEVEASDVPLVPLPEDLITNVRNQLAIRGYRYPESTIRQVILALSTEQLIVLTGPSGTGKTSLVSLLASLLNANVEIIPVQPNWTDRQDLLGFYNPIRRMYVSSAFLDCLAEARDNEERLYFVCLDELNLAQIEYYLADLLSVRELENGKIRLYSDHEQKQNMDEIKFQIPELSSQHEPVQATDYELSLRYQNLKRYPALFDIPKNVRIIGTMNMDGNVQALSPKVIDRSFIIPVHSLDKPERNSSDGSKVRYAASAADFAPSVDVQDLSSILKSALNAFKKEMQTQQIEFNQRFERHVLLYYAAAKKRNVKTQQQVDDLVLSKLLPRLHQDTQGTNFVSNIYGLLREHATKDTSSEKMLNRMLVRSAETQILSYWS